MRAMHRAGKLGPLLSGEPGEGGGLGPAGPRRIRHNKRLFFASDARHPPARRPSARTPRKCPTRLPLSAAMASRSEEHTSELQSLMRISYAVFCLKKKKNIKTKPITEQYKRKTKLQ